MIRVLLADDHGLVRRMLRQLLEREGDIAVCGEAADGEAAVQMLGECTPDVAVLDLSMPGLNGLEAAQRIRALRPDTKVLIVTIHDSERLVEAAFAAGAGGYLLKSEAPDHLLAAVRALARDQTS